MNKFLSFLSNLFKSSPSIPKGFTGALGDSRPPEQKKDDINFNDIVASANAVNWQNKTVFRDFPVFDQKGSYMCGAFAMKKALGVMYQQKYGNYVNFSEEDIYQRRMNKPNAGMYLNDMFNIANGGVTLKELTNVDIESDNDADTVIIPKFKHDVGSIFSVNGAPIYINGGDIETIASVIQTTGKGVILLMFFTSNEWSQYMPVVYDPNLYYESPNALRHYVVAVDNTLVNGVKYLVVDDSAHFGGLGRRLVSANFLAQRNVTNAYPMNFKFEVSNTKPKYDGSIISVQRCLQSIGLFPMNVSFVESLGPVTRKALIAYQAKNTLPQSGLLDLNTTHRLSLDFP